MHNLPTDSTVYELVTRMNEIRLTHALADCGEVDRLMQRMKTLSILLSVTIVCSEVRDGRGKNRTEGHVFFHTQDEADKAVAKEAVKIYGSQVRLSAADDEPVTRRTSWSPTHRYL